MTIFLNIGLEQAVAPLQPGLSKEAQWGKDTYDTVDYDELKPLQQKYTSLRDLIVVSPTKRAFPRGQDVEWCDVAHLKFKDNLLRLAARAYLQPMCKDSTPEMHFIAQCWMTFIEGNKALIAGIVESLQKQVDTCVKFFREQTFSLMQLFKPQEQIGSLQL